MTIKTRYDIGDMVHFMTYNKRERAAVATYGKVVGIDARATMLPSCGVCLNNWYTVRIDDAFEVYGKDGLRRLDVRMFEDALYGSKEELKDSL